MHNSPEKGGSTAQGHTKSTLFNDPVTNTVNMS